MFRFSIYLTCFLVLTSCGPVPIPPLRGESNTRLYVKDTPGKNQNSKPAKTADKGTTKASTTSTPQRKSILAKSTSLVNKAATKKTTKNVIVIAAKIDSPKKLSSMKSKTSKNYSSAEQYIKKRKYKLAITTLERASSSERKKQSYRELMISAYIGHTKHLIDIKKYSAADKTISKALKIAPNRRTVQTLAKIINRNLLSTKHYRQGVIAITQGDNEKAIQEFNHVLALDKNHANAKQKVQQLTHGVTLSLHEKAMELYDAQQLDKAIAIWEDLLRIDPNHHIAKDYIRKSIGIKKRISATN